MTVVHTTDRCQLNLRYLQVQGLLTQFYHEFRKSVATDLTGHKTLQSVLGTDDMVAFKQRWEAYTAALGF